MLCVVLYNLCYLFDDNDNLIKEYLSITVAAEEMKVDASCITGVLRGRRKHCRGFVWKYL